MTQLQLDPTVVAIADLLHDLTCIGNHIDYCAWFYESWEKPGYHRNFAYRAAKRFVRAGGTLAMMQALFCRVPYTDKPLTSGEV